MNDSAGQRIDDPIGRGYAAGVEDALEAFKAFAEAEQKLGDGRALRIVERYAPQVRAKLDGGE